MRARIRVFFALLTALGLVPGTAAIAVAQEPPGTAAPAATPAEPETVRLSLEDAVERALKNNNDIAVERYNPELSAESVRSAEGYYDPLLFANLSRNSTDTKGTNVFSGADVLNSKRDVWNFGVDVPIKTGATFQVVFDNNKTKVNNVFARFNPIFQSSLDLSVTQPLLKNFKIDAPRQQLRIAKINREISDVQFHQTIVNTVATVKYYYYDLIYAMDNLGAAQKSLDLAKQLLQENEIRVKVGTMAPLDVVSARAEVAAREEGVIVAENAVAEAEDTLKQAIFPENDPKMWATRIVLTDRPSDAPVPVDMAGAVSKALAERTDIVSARKALERSDVSLSYRKSQLLPQLDLVATYGASGAGGPEFVREDPLGPITETIPGGYGDAVREVFGRDYPTWTVGFNVSYAIPNRSAKALAAQARISKEQALASLRRLEMQVAAEVRTAARAVESGIKQVASSKAARELAAERLDAEQKKFAAGMSTNYLVTQAQRDLADQEVAQIQAIASYAKSVVNFQRVQEAGLSGSGAVAVLSSGTSSQAGQALQAGAAASSVNQSTGRTQF
jgi:outer membrane protein